MLKQDLDNRISVIELRNQVPSNGEKEKSVPSERTLKHNYVCSTSTL